MYAASSGCVDEYILQILQVRHMQYAESIAVKWVKVTFVLGETMSTRYYSTKPRVSIT